VRHGKSFVWLFAFAAFLFSLGLAPYLTQEAFALAPTITSYVADDPDNLDGVYSNGDTLTITLSAGSNATAQVVQNAAITGNFTFTTADPLTGGAVFTGEWTSNSVLVITMTTIGTAISLGTAEVDVNGATNNIGITLNNTDNTVMVPAANVALTGDFGIVAAAASSNNGGGSGCNGDCEEPTLGVDSVGKRHVTNGFTYNGYSVDVERFFTPYPLITADVGKQNKAEFKIYENQGPENIKHFSFAFGLGKDQIISESKAMIELDIDHEGIETVTITDPENALDNIRVETSIVSCSDDSKTKCLGVTIFHKFRAPLDFNIVATDMWDRKRSSWQNYYNHGIEVVGKSLNPPNEYDGINKGQIYHLTETGKTTAVDEFGNSWSLKYGQWAMDYIPNKKIIDEIAMNGYPREHAKFNMYKYGQFLVAEDTLRETCLECFDESYAEINDIFAYEYPIAMSPLEKLEIQKNMIIESEKAQKILNHLFDPILHLK